MDEAANVKRELERHRKWSCDNVTPPLGPKHTIPPLNSECQSSCPYYFLCTNTHQWQLGAPTCSPATLHTTVLFPVFFFSPPRKLLFSTSMYKKVKKMYIPAPAELFFSSAPMTAGLAFAVSCVQNNGRGEATY